MFGELTRAADSPEAKIQNSKSKIQNSPPPQSLIAHHPSPITHSPLLLALGCSWAILEEAHITLMAVHPAYQRQGLGQAMLYALLMAAYKRRLERATLEVRASNQAAIALYEKFGFKTAGRRKRYYQDTGEDALVMWRSGLHQAEFAETLKQWWHQVSDRLHQSGWQLLQ
ncbi:MAG: ribosomal protein S18-alanine N-acetyltransferase [Oscillatoriales cyanobacterium C42_A2020_001]|nr:ribosomal protein S18-alanine N-acetyltransferase [Leptolyngbyaceae cyanobacterium C42_A2020_001]